MDGLAGDLILQLRLPRLIAAFAVGMGLAIAGGVLQALFSNPLCDPYTLGISSGATLGAVIGVSLGWSLEWGGIVPTALLGALVFLVLLLTIGQLFSSRSVQGGNLILLTGVMLWFLGSSLVSLWMAVADPAGVQGAVFWLLGDLSRADLGGAMFSFLGISILSLLIGLRSKWLDAFLVNGDEGQCYSGFLLEALGGTSFF